MTVRVPIPLKVAWAFGDLGWLTDAQMHDPDAVREAVVQALIYFAKGEL